MTPDRLRGVPNQPKTPQRTVRVPDEVWLAAKEVADHRGESLSDVIRTALERYVRRHASAGCEWCAEQEQPKAPAPSRKRSGTAS